MYAEVRDPSGRAVPDGTEVLFSTTLGTFRESLVKTINGRAYATLVSGGTAGIAKITASAIGASVTPSVLEFEFVADRKMLSSALEYVEIVAPSYMHYTVDSRQISASGANHGVSLRYRDVEIEADDLQLDVPTYEVRARNAKLKVGKESHVYSQLYYRLNLRRGYGTTTFKAPRWTTLAPVGRGLQFATIDVDGAAIPARNEDRFGLAQIVAGEPKPTTETVSNNLFELADLSDSPSTISARKVVVFPQKGVQFQKADMYIGGRKVMSMPLYELTMSGQTSPIATDQLVSVFDNQLAINYPYYLSLRPGQTSLLRFHTGDRYNRGVGSSGGAFLDYELNWNHGDDVDGNLTFSGIGRSDWMLSAHQYTRWGERTQAVLQGELLANRTFFGNASLSRQFEGFQASLSSSHTETLRGIKTSTQQDSLVIEKDPIKMGKLPVQLYYGLTSNSTRSTFGSQSGSGVQLRAQSSAIPFNKTTSLTSSLTLAKLYGSSNNPGLTILGSTALSHRFGNSANTVLSYDFTRDGLNDAVLGEHRLSLSGSLFYGNTNLTLYTTRGLDKDRFALYGDLSYRLGGLWRTGVSYTLDKYQGESYLDYTFVLGYRVGWRDIGLTWSYRTKRIGFQLLGASF